MENKIRVDKGEQFREIITVVDSLIDNKTKEEHNVYFQQNLRSEKPKKLLNRKQKFVKKSTLTRKEYADLGLYNIPRKSIKYNDMLPLNQLWEQYVTSHLGLDNPNFKVPQPGDPQFLNFSCLLCKSDLHGAKLTIVESKCPSVVGKEGIVVLETKHTFAIVEKDNRTRTIPKADSVFQIRIRKLEMIIFGKHLNIRPAERSVKKIKTYMDLYL